MEIKAFGEDIRPWFIKATLLN